MANLDRLNFRIPEFVRVAWVSPKAEETWAPIIQECSNFYTQLERFNRTAIINVRPEEFIGHSYIPLYQSNRASTYQSGAAQFNPNLPWDYRCAAGPDAEKLARAYIAQDWASVGALLGYPECCISFFMKYWVQEQWFDTTLPMGKNNLLSPANNILLRWVGIRLVSHLPCSFNCVHTAKIGLENIELAGSLGHEREIGKIIELLSFPVEWTSLHGIATITTPIFKIITASDALPVRASIRLDGVDHKYPLEAASGNRFPFFNKADTWTANGFSDLASMQRAHGLILDALAPISPKSVIDFGCGNGLLLKLIRQEFEADTFGIDNDPTKHPDCCMDIYETIFGNDTYDVALIAEQRTVENPVAWFALRARIQQNCRYLCIYNYSTGVIKLLDTQDDRENYA